MQQRRNNTGIHTAGQCQQYLIILDLFFDLFDLYIDKRPHTPILLGLADIKNKIMDHLITMNGMTYFRMKLDSIETTFCICHHNDRTRSGRRTDLKAFRCLRYLIAMAHPYLLLLIQSLYQRIFFYNGNIRFPIFRMRTGFHFTSEFMSHDLHAIADPQNRNPQLKQLFVRFHRIYIIYRIRPSGKNDTLNILIGLYFSGGQRMWT